MQRTLAVSAFLASLLVPLGAWATCSTAVVPGATRSVIVTCTTGTETCASLASATDGMLLGPSITEGNVVGPVAGFSVQAEAAAGQTLASGSLLVCERDDISGRWRPMPDTCSLSATAARDHSPCTGGGFTVISPRGRIALVPSGVTVSSGSVTIRLLATGPNGYPL